MTDAEIVAWAEKNDRLAEMCSLVDYDPNIGRVPEHWVPYWYIRDLVAHSVEAQEQPAGSEMPTLGDAWAAIHAELDACGIQDRAEMVVKVMRYGEVRFKQGEYCAALSRPQAASSPTGPREGEPVAEVLWHDPELDVMPPKPGKIIDASIEFMESAPIGTKLYAAPLRNLVHEEHMRVLAGCATGYQVINKNGEAASGFHYKTCRDEASMLDTLYPQNSPHSVRELFAAAPETASARSSGDPLVEELSRFLEATADPEGVDRRVGLAVELKRAILASRPAAGGGG